MIPGFGGTQRLPRRVGPAMAIDLVTTGRKIDAQEALRIGLVNRVMPQAELENYVEELTKQLKGNGPQSVRGAKQAVHDGMDQDLDSALALKPACSPSALPVTNRKRAWRPLSRSVSQTFNIRC
ncbi:hypothetical protein HSBAA_15810 [Vreelandella sulfidaeris]|uniref:Enoyl-CoA hydratase n=1 Tax=Vreelandella sulfidaeris TaxID=115553 RepID=A0A455U354_9GAMM|nr:hypothetical protein HSBAA_15810 [Halomonas sulfidaeris]